MQLQHWGYCTVVWSRAGAHLKFEPNPVNRAIVYPSTAKPCILLTMHTQDSSHKCFNLRVKCWSLPPSFRIFVNAEHLLLIRQQNTQQLSFLLAGLLIPHRFSICVYMVYNFPKSHSCWTKLKILFLAFQALMVQVFNIRLLGMSLFKF